MRQWVRYGVGAMVALGFGAVGTAAHAQSYFDLGTLTSAGKNFTIGAWTLGFAGQPSTPTASSGCYYDAAAGGSCGDVMVKAEVHRGDLYLTFFENASGGTTPDGNLLSGAPRGDNTNRNLYFNFKVTDSAVSNTLKLTGASAGLSTNRNNASGGGTTDVDPSNNVNMTEYLCSSANFPCASGTSFTSLTVNSAASNPTLVSVPAVNQANVLSVNKALFSTGGGYNISTLTQRYVSNPEPISIAVFGVGLAGAVLARRRARRPHAKFV